MEEYLFFYTINMLDLNANVALPDWLEITELLELTVVQEGGTFMTRGSLLVPTDNLTVSKEGDVAN